MHSLASRFATLSFAAIALLALMLVLAPAALAGPPQQYHGAQMHAFWGGVSASDNARELDLLP